MTTLPDSCVKRPSSEPITLTSAAATPAPGDWGGVLIAGKATLNYVKIQYAGSTLCYLACYNAGLVVRGESTATPSNPAVSHVTVDQSSGNGVEMDGGAFPVHGRGVDREQ